MIRRLGAAAILGLLGLGACSAEQPRPEPPGFETADACSLLRGDEVFEVDDRSARSAIGSTVRDCDWTSSRTQVELDLVLKPFAEESERLMVNGGYGAVINDRPMTRRCADASGLVTCEGVVEVRDGQLIEIEVVRRHPDPDAIGQLTQELTLKALERLPK
ncbi:hypothetical protein [Lentzea albida]|uniref:hypothetical protein n=1 Tax=Lentzea albida TaxID=65499 RepID=UPI000B7EC750|nr:hypothetical protein [Lentzea albida]